MPILVVNPNTTQAMTDDNLELATVAAASDTTVEALNPIDGPPSIEGHADEIIAAHYTLELVAETLGRYDGYVIACFGDPVVRVYGCEARCASIRAVQMGVLEIAQDFDRAKRMILEEACLRPEPKPLTACSAGLVAAYEAA